MFLLKESVVGISDFVRGELSRIMYQIHGGICTFCVSKNSLVISCGETLRRVCIRTMKRSKSQETLMNNALLQVPRRICADRGTQSSLGLKKLLVVERNCSMISVWSGTVGAEVG